MPARIPLSQPVFDERETEAVRRVLASGWVVQGPEVEAFEAGIAQLHQARHCIAVSSGTAALHVCYLGLGMGPGDAVFIPSFAWPSAAHMAKLVGARPVFVDVLPDTYNLDPQDLVRRIEDCLSRGWGKPRAVVPVHEFGLAADMDQIRAVAARYSLEVIEDAACALGANYRGRPVGTLGKMGIFSFHPRKSLTTGEGGAIVTDDSELAAQCRMWRNHGQVNAGPGREFRVPGLNYRMTEFQASIGRVQLTRLGDILKSRRDLASIYERALAGSPRLRLPPWEESHTWQTFMVTLDSEVNRGRVIEALAREGIEAGPGSVAGHLAASMGRQEALSVSEMLHRQGLALPLFMGLSSDAILEVVTRLQRCLGEPT